MREGFRTGFKRPLSVEETFEADAAPDFYDLLNCVSFVNRNEFN